MKYSSTLLKKFISVNDSPENIAKNLILKTCEIEEVHTRILPDEVVIGKVKSFAKHPEADKLNVCQVDGGKKGMYEIVCGGENMAEGIYVPVALPSCFLPAIGIQIEPRKMRGITSNGMICSKQELGINEDLDKHNIWDLGEDLEVEEEDLGKMMKEKYPWMEGYIMEVDSKSLTNRPDLTGHRGIATELNAIYGQEKGSIIFNKTADYYKQWQTTNIIETLENSTKGKKKVVAKTEGLNTYILLELNNVTIQQSNFFTRLQMIDMACAPRSNRVDFSNLFMLISGQPIHFFDADKIEGDIVVRNAKDGEEFTDLFSYTHTLKDTDIVIADKKKILALAGVVGGIDSGITEDTKNILVEIANFDSVAVRKTGTRLGLRTDAELRYEKNINPVWSLHCLLLFLDELKYYAKDLGSFEIGGLDYFASKAVLKEIKNPKKVDLHYEKMSEFIFGKKIADLPKEHKGFEIAAQAYLEGLGFILAKKGFWTVPCWRGPDDINITEDMYEEVARLYGYENISPFPLLSELKNVAYTEHVELTRKLEETLVNNFGFVQTETYPRLSEKAVKNVGNESALYKLQNPVNPETPYLRGDMYPELLAHVAKNSKFFDEFKIFDIGKVWNTTNTLTVGKFASEFVNETMNLGMMIYTKNISSWNKDPILFAKEIVKSLVPSDGLSFEKSTHHNYHPKKQAHILLGGKKIGFVGSIHPLVLKDHKIPETAGVVSVQIDLDKLLAYSTSTGERIYTYETLQDQIVFRDLCFVVDEKLDFGGVLDAVKSVKGPAASCGVSVKGVEVFDVYAGESLGEGKKSISIKMKIIGDGTMTTEQINEVMNQAIKAGEKAGGTLRT